MASKKKNIAKVNPNKQPIIKFALLPTTVTDSINVGAANDNPTPEDVKTLTGVLISGFVAAFNPDTNLGGIRLSFKESPTKDFNQINGSVFAAALSLLAVGGATYNGQYIIISR